MSLSAARTSFSPDDRAAPSPRLRRHLALLHPERAAVALTASSTGAGRLLADDRDVEEPGAIEGLGFLAAEVGSLGAVLGCLGESGGEAASELHRLYLGEVMPGAPAPPERGTGWWESGDEPPEGLPPDLVAPLAAVLDRVAGRVAFDHRQPPFARPGGTAALAASLAQRLGASGPAIDAGAPERLWQLKAWSISSVWANERVVLKAAHPMWPAEPALTTLLGDLVPATVPAVAAVGAFEVAGSAAPWLLQQRVHGLRPASDVGGRARLALTMATLQRRLRDELATFESVGLPDRHLDTLEGSIGTIWSSSELDALEVSERARLAELDAWLRERLDVLRVLEAPRVLVHGDLHGGNAIVADDRLMIIDWTDAALSFPGVDLATIIGFGEDPRDPIWQGVVDAYVTAWGPALGAHGDELIDASLDVALAYHAVSYIDIARAVAPESHWELAGTVRYLVRRMLDRLARA